MGMQEAASTKVGVMPRTGNVGEAEVVGEVDVVEEDRIHLQLTLANLGHGTT